MYRDCIRVLAALTAALTVVCSMRGLVFAAGMENEEFEREVIENVEEQAETEPEEQSGDMSEESEEISGEEALSEPENEQVSDLEENAGEEPEQNGSTEQEEESDDLSEEILDSNKEETLDPGPEEAAPLLMPPFEAQKQAGDITVLVHAGQGVFPEGTRVEIREMSYEESASLLREAERLSGGAAGLSAVDITFLDREGKEVQPLGMVQITFLNAAAYEEISVYHVTDLSGERMEEIQAEVINGDVVFENDRFSPYLLLGAAGEPDWTQGGAGTMKNVSTAVSLTLRDAEWSNYYTWGRDYSSYNTTEALTVRYDVYYKGRRVGTASCINPQMDGDYAEGRQANAVYEITAPMLVKAFYYGNSGPGRSVVQSVYNAGHDPGEDKNYGGPEIITHVAVSEIYARLYPSMSKTGPGRGFAGPTTALLRNDVYTFVSKLNTLPVPENYYVYLAQYNGNVQDFALGSKPLGRGKLYIRKTAAGSEITEGNPHYELSGAIYRVYTSEAAARAGADADYVGELQTKPDGTTDYWEGTVGTYYIVEKVPPQGYLLDETVYRVTVAEGGTTEVKTVEQPAVSLLPLRIMKKNLLEGTQQGRSLAGTQFEIRYYSAYYEEDTLPEEPEKVWTVTTKENEDGTAEAELSDDSEGDPLFVLDGMPGIPLGTVTIQEKSAPFGYLQDGLFGEAELYIGHIYRTEDGKGVFWKDIQGERAEDDGEAVRFVTADTPVLPEICTQARDAENETSYSMADEEVKIKDSVTCTALIPGKEYTLRGRLIDKSTGSVIRDADGNEVTAEKTFIAADQEEEIQELVFQFAADPTLAGKTAVVFEQLIGSEPDLAGAVHEDLEDENQTIFFPSIETSAEDQSDHDKTISPAGQAVVVDHIAYRNLIPEKTYRVLGILMDKRTEKPALSDGKEIRGETVFVAEGDTGSTQVVFRFNAEDLREGDYVVFEELYLEGETDEPAVMMARHKDIGSASQTIMREKTKSGTPLTGDDFSPLAWGSLGAAVLGLLIFALMQRRHSCA